MLKTAWTTVNDSISCKKCGKTQEITSNKSRKLLIETKSTNENINTDSTNESDLYCAKLTFIWYHSCQSQNNKMPLKGEKETLQSKNNGSCTSFKAFHYVQVYVHTYTSTRVYM